MKINQLFKKLIPILMGCMVSAFVMADTSAPTAPTCPTSLKPNERFFSMPYGFDHQKKTVSYFAMDVMHPDAEKSWYILVYPVPVSQLENNIERAKAVMQELTPVSETPFIWHEEYNDESYYCIYTHPTLSKVTAVVFYDEDEGDDDDWMQSKHRKSKHARIMLAAKSLLKAG